MATTEPVSARRERLAGVLRPALEDPTGADRLACVQAGRARFEAAVGAPPGGALAALPSPFAGVELPGEAERLLEDVAGGPGAIGAGYEAALDAADRDAAGQYFTPDPIADALVRWALAGADRSAGPPRLLDPAAGTGTFLRVAFGRLRARHPGVEPAALLDRLVGVDVDAAALHLAGLALGAAAELAAPERLRLHHRSFFDCAPASDGEDGTGQLPVVDAVVGNPPFVRAAALQPDAEHFREHLGEFGPAGATPWLDGDDALSRRSDAYVYFVTQATRFLRPGGRLALVLPTKWLMSAYGEGLRRFLRDRYRVHAVVGFEGRAFDDALVDTALLLAERAPDASASAPLRFVRLGAPVDADRLLAAVGDAPDRPPSVERRQGSLTAPGSLARFLEAPAELLELLDGHDFVRLDDLAEVARGTMTGANRFFFLDAAAVERFGIDAAVRRPAVKSLRSIDRPAVEAGDVERWLVDVHPVVTAAAEGSAARDPTAAAKAALAERGHDGLLAYVEHAEREGWHEGRTCQSRRVWFDLGPLRAPAAFVPKLLRERVYAVRNAARAVPSNAIDGVWPNAGVHTGALLAVLNASVGAAAMEVTGRDEAGLLQLMTYESASLPTLDVSTLPADEATALAAAGDAYAADPGPGTLAALDEAVDGAFDLAVGPGELRELAVALRRRRVDGAETSAVAG